MQPELRGARGAPTERLVGGVAALCEAIWPHGASDLAAEGVGKRVAALCDFWVTGVRREKAGAGLINNLSESLFDGRGL